MFQPDGKPCTLGRHRRWPVLSALVLSALLVAVPTSGQPGGNPEAAEALLEQLEDSYDILTLSDSYLLQPKDSEAGLRSIEIKSGLVAVNGDDITQEQLREMVGDVASTIFALSLLGSAEPEPLAEPSPEPSAESSAAEELRRRIERLAEERRLKAEEIEDLVRSRVDELESLEQEQLEALEESLEGDREVERERRRDQRREERDRRRRGSVRTDTRVSFGSSLTVEEHETSRDVVVIGGSLDVEGKVRGDAVVVGGSAEVRGEVSGTVTAVGGSISLGPGARIEGDAVSIGGAVQRDPSAEIRGEITEVSLAPGLDLDDVWEDAWVPHWRFGGFDFGVGELFARIGRSVALGVLLFLLVLIFPRLIAGISNRALREPWKAGIVGLGAQLLFLFALPVVCFILMITIVGIPLALLLAPLATFALIVFFLFGFAGIAAACGELLKKRFDWHTSSPYLLVLLGLALIQGWSILGEGLGFLGGPIRVLGWLALLLGFLIKYTAWTTGLGATLLHYLSPLPPPGRSVVTPLPAGGGFASGPPTPPPPSPPNPPAPPLPWDVPVDESGELIDPDDEYREAGADPEATDEEGAEDEESFPQPAGSRVDEILEELDNADEEYRRAGSEEAQPDVETEDDADVEPEANVEAEPEADVEAGPEADVEAEDEPAEDPGDEKAKK